MFLSCKYLKTEMLLKPSSRHRSSKNNIFKSSKSFSGRKMMLCLGCNIFFEVASCFDYNLFFNTFSCTFQCDQNVDVKYSKLNKNICFNNKAYQYLGTNDWGKARHFLLHFYRLFESFPRFGKSVRTLFNGCFDFPEKLS